MHDGVETELDGLAEDVLRPRHIRTVQIVGAAGDPDFRGGVNDRVAALQRVPYGRGVSDIGLMQRNRLVHPEVGQHPARFPWIAHEEQRLVPVGEKAGDGVRADET
ncbi:hypothetical protein GCM10017559_51340 [Streptosporangium longisporum]|uniref:Uncharacterized protein n=1 Tax=Streptosporangium longisporum TaxID=46187 RepID=A0ABN3Y9T1_9ACTN